MTVPVMMFGIFSVHMASGGTLTTRSIFTALSLLTLLQKYVIRLYVKGVFSLIELNVAISRIKVHSVIFKAYILETYCYLDISGVG